LRRFSFGGYGLALVALALVVFGAYDSYHKKSLVGLGPRLYISRENLFVEGFGWSLLSVVEISQREGNPHTVSGEYFVVGSYFSHHLSSLPEKGL